MPYFSTAMMKCHDQNSLQKKVHLGLWFQRDRADSSVRVWQQEQEAEAHVCSSTHRDGASLLTLNAPFSPSTLMTHFLQQVPYPQTAPPTENQAYGTFLTQATMHTMNCAIVAF